jgi:hypothetical protein
MRTFCPKEYKIVALRECPLLVRQLGYGLISSVTNARCHGQRHCPINCMLCREQNFIYILSRQPAPSRQSRRTRQAEKSPSSVM